MLRLPLILLCLTSLVSVVLAADMVVIHSNATHLFARGQLLDGNTLIKLPAETQITVVFSSGDVQTVNGPYQRKLKKPPTTPTNNKVDDENLVMALSQFLIEKETVRGLSQSQENLWLVDVSTHKRFYCVAPSSPVILWRPESQSYSASNMLIKHKPTGQEVKVVWPAYQTTLAWPGSLPVNYGDTYTMEIKTRSRTSFKKLVLYQLPDSLPTKSHKVVWMVGRGCIPQANLLLANLG